MGALWAQHVASPLPSGSTLGFMFTPPMWQNVSSSGTLNNLRIFLQWRIPGDFSWGILCRRQRAPALDERGCSRSGHGVRAGPRRAGASALLDALLSPQKSEPAGPVPPTRDWGARSCGLFHASPALSNWMRRCREDLLFLDQVNSSLRHNLGE